MGNAKGNIVANTFVRYKKSTGDDREYVPSDDLIIFLEHEIDQYRDKIAAMQEALYRKCDEIVRLKRLVRRMYGECIEIQPTTQLEAVQQSATTEIIKALSDNGYNTITINCYKDTESEEN